MRYTHNHTTHVFSLLISLLLVLVLLLLMSSIPCEHSIFFHIDVLRRAQAYVLCIYLSTIYSYGNTLPHILVHSFMCTHSNAGIHFLAARFYSGDAPLHELWAHLGHLSTVSCARAEPKVWKFVDTCGRVHNPYESNREIETLSKDEEHHCISFLSPTNFYCYLKMSIY